MSFLFPESGNLALPVREVKFLIKAHETGSTHLEPMGTLGLRYFDALYTQNNTTAMAHKYLTFLGTYILEIREYVAFESRFYGWAVHTPRNTLHWDIPKVSIREEGVEVEWNSDAPLESFPLAERTALHALTPAQLTDAYAIHTEADAVYAPPQGFYTGPVLG